MQFWKFWCVFLLLPGLILLYPINSEVEEFYSSLSTEERRYFYQYYLAKAVTNETSIHTNIARDFSIDLALDIPNDVLNKLEGIDAVVPADLPNALYNALVTKYEVTQEEICTFIASSSCHICNRNGECMDPCDGPSMCCI